MIEIACENDVDTPQTITIYYNHTFTYRFHEVVRDNENLIDLSRQRHEWAENSHTRSNISSSDSSHVVSDDEDLQMYNTHQ